MPALPVPSTAATALIENYLRQAEGEEPYDSLTDREREILKLIAEEHTSPEIADKLFISLKTVQGSQKKRSPIWYAPPILTVLQALYA